MRLAVVTTESQSLHTYTGGIGPRFEHLAVELAGRGHEVTFVTSTINLDRSRVWGHPDVQLLVADVDDIRTPLFPALLARRVSALVAAQNVDVALAPEWGGLLAPLARDSQRATKVVTNLATASRQIRQIEGRGLPANPSERVVETLRERIEALQARRSDRVFAISHPIRDWAVAEWGVGDVAVIPNGISIADVKREATAGVALGHPGAPSVVFAGRVSRWKGADVFAQAVRQLWSRGLTPDCHVMGRVSPDCESVMSDLARDGEQVGASVRIHGHVDRRTVLATVASATVAIFPSRFEGFGNACLEAKALGTAVVATSGSGFSEFCSHDEDSLLAEPGNAGQLADAMAELLTNSSKREQLAECGERSARQFDTRQYAIRVERLLQEVI